MDDIIVAGLQRPVPQLLIGRLPLRYDTPELSIPSGQTPTNGTCNGLRLTSSRRPWIRLRTRHAPHGLPRPATTPQTPAVPPAGASPRGVPDDVAGPTAVLPLQSPACLPPLQQTQRSFTKLVHRSNIALMYKHV